MTLELRQRHVLITGTPGTVASAGTAQRLVVEGPTGQRTMAASVLVYAETGNAGNIYLGDDSVSASNGIPIAPGYSEEHVSPDGGLIDLTQLYVDADVTDDGYRFKFLF